MFYGFKMQCTRRRFPNFDGDKCKSWTSIPSKTVTLLAATRGEVNSYSVVELFYRSFQFCSTVWDVEASYYVSVHDIEYSSHRWSKGGNWRNDFPLQHPFIWRYRTWLFSRGSPRIPSESATSFRIKVLRCRCKEVRTCTKYGNFTGP